jgi:NAD-dependent deacetylase
VPSTELWPVVVERGEVPYCPKCQGVLKPDVVLFGELLPMDVLLEAQRETERCDVMLVAGSSLEVYPAAELPMRAWQHGAQVILINYHPTDMDSRASVVIHANVATVMPQIVAQVKELRGIA